MPGVSRCGWCARRSSERRPSRLRLARLRRWNFSQLGHIDHRKVVVVDGRIGWVGGAGIEDHFEDGRFHDLFVRLTGPVVSQLQLVFVSSFAWLGGVAHDLEALFPDHEQHPDAVPATVLHNAPGGQPADHESR